MKAIVQTAYGDPDEVLELREITEPTAGSGEVLVKVHAASVHPDVWHVVRGVPSVLRLMGAGVREPKVLVPGTDLAGRVESVGAGAKRFRPGDEVYGEIVSVNQWRNAATYAEYVAVSEDRLWPKPSNITFEQAAAVPTSASIAVRGLRDEARLRAGQRVLINGAGGGVGTFAVQIAKAIGADVTGVDSRAKLEMLREIGADRVIDYAEQDFTRSGERYDLVFDIAGRSWSDVKRALRPDGTYVLIGHDHFGSAGRRLGSLGRFAGLLLLAPFDRRLTGLRGARPSEDPMAVVHRLVEAGSITPVVGRTFPLEEAVAAIHALEAEQVPGKIVLAV
jgi:NADPH:quinone reductase-like Zn-dependent oxidoreductase